MCDMEMSPMVKLCTVQYTVLCTVYCVHYMQYILYCMVRVDYYRLGWSEAAMQCMIGSHVA